MTFENDEARRAHFTELLRQKLRDPEFRKIEGFPIGEDEDILAMSDPPYYTACPNPWISFFVHEYGHEYISNVPYHREPFAADIEEGKQNQIYKAHSYHTKVPHRAIMRFILHYTRPGDLILDGFAGTGMTAVAASLCGNVSEVRELGFQVDDSGRILDAEGNSISHMGARSTVLQDLSPAATFISHNYNTDINPDEFENWMRKIISSVEQSHGWMYVTLHGATTDEIRLAGEMIASCKNESECRMLLSDISQFKTRLGIPNATFHFAKSSYNVWSDIFLCPECSEEIDFVREALDLNTRKVKDLIFCPGCSASLKKSQMERAMETYYDQPLRRTATRAKQELVLICYSFGGSEREKSADFFDLSLNAKACEVIPEHFFPTLRMPEGDESRRNDGIGLTHVHHYYRPRALCAMSKAYAVARHAPSSIRGYLIFAVEQIVLGMAKIARYAPTHYSQVNQYLSGTLYVGSQVVDVSISYILAGKVRNLVRLLRARRVHSSCIVSTGSSSTIGAPDNAFDYVFVDPPFGGNLTYSALNFFWESWHRVLTNAFPEAITNQAAGKDAATYKFWMDSCFKEFFRVLKPGRWITVEFSNTQASIWNIIQSTLQDAGFVVSNVSALDKLQGSFKAITTTTAVKQDLIISAYKPGGSFEERIISASDHEEGVWEFVATHLQYLPVTRKRGTLIEFIPERDPRILFDQLVSYFVRKRIPVPMSSADFQTGLLRRFPSRDGMVFLPDQVTSYDSARQLSESLSHADLFVCDERSAIQWVRRELTKRALKYQDIVPLYLQQAQRLWGRHERPTELLAILQENFVQDPDGTWRVPDPQKESDLEQLRHRALLKEFQQYLDTKGKLKVLRTEALRAGFKEAWQKKDYATIVTMAKRVPDAVIQEDQALLMYFDNASLMLGE
jgi:DNA modification methylase